MGLGLGAVLSILACPGAFASIFLMTKYSTLLQFVHGVFFDPIARSPSDEYFFVGLSMTITGLVMVARWNRLFPDRRDFANLVVLPIRIRDIFLANLAALIGLALVFGLDVNAVSALFFPFFVALSLNSFTAMIHVGIAHAATVFAASLFSFFSVFALVGVLMLVVPQNLFRRVSVLARMSLVVVLLSGFFSNIVIQLFMGRLAGGTQSYLKWLPAYWFLGIYESILGIAKPHMAAMGRQAILALLLAVLVSLLSYALCYRRLFLRLAETFDLVGGVRPFFRIKFPDTLLSPLFRSAFERACSSFAAKVLLRSEQHLMFLGAYLGIGLVFVAQNSADSERIVASAGLLQPNYLAMPLLVAFFILTGLRFSFDRPAVLDANWIFRSIVSNPLPAPRSVAKRLMLWATLPWEVGLILPMAVMRLGWLRGLLHGEVLILVTALSADALLVFFRKIPFTCGVQLDIKQLLMHMIAAVFSVLALVPAFATFERWMLLQPGRVIPFNLIAVAVWLLILRQRRVLDEYEQDLVFEAVPAASFELLRLN